MNTQVDNLVKRAEHFISRSDEMGLDELEETYKALNAIYKKLPVKPGGPLEKLMTLVNQAHLSALDKANGRGGAEALSRGLPKRPDGGW